MGYISETFLSDIEEDHTTGTCACGSTSFYWIETDGEWGKYRALYCRPCGDRLLAQLQENAEAAHAADKAAATRLGFDPKNFCEFCGYRYEAPAFCFGCRCQWDPLNPWPTPEYSHPLYRDERREILAGWDRPRVPSLSR